MGHADVAAPTRNQSHPEHARRANLGVPHPALPVLLGGHTVPDRANRIVTVVPSEVESTVEAEES
jgi:hypothetical protein